MSLAEATAASRSTAKMLMKDEAEDTVGSVWSAECDVYCCRWQLLSLALIRKSDYVKRGVVRILFVGLFSS